MEDRPMNDDEVNRSIIDRDRLPPLFPTHRHAPQFWEQLGRTIATHGFLEEVWGKQSSHSRRRATIAPTKSTRLIKHGCRSLSGHWQINSGTWPNPTGRPHATIQLPLPRTSTNWLKTLRKQRLFATSFVMAHGEHRKPTAHPCRFSSIGRNRCSIPQ